MNPARWPDCARFHEATGCCVCTTVACVYCDKRHAPHKPCPKPQKGKKP